MQRRTVPDALLGRAIMTDTTEDAAPGVRRTFHPRGDSPA
jgi:hypothetical protein